jgi:hypothetical protein
MELALYFRTLDDKENLTAEWKQIGRTIRGNVVSQKWNH